MDTLPPFAVLMVPVVTTLRPVPLSLLRTLPHLLQALKVNLSSLASTLTTLHDPPLHAAAPVTDMTKKTNAKTHIDLNIFFCIIISSIVSTQP